MNKLISKLNMYKCLINRCFGLKAFALSVLFVSLSFFTLIAQNKWVQNYIEVEETKAIVQTADGGYVFTGASKAPTDPTVYNDIYVYRTDEFGAKRWTTIIDHSVLEVGQGIVKSGDGFVVTGYFFNGLPNSTGTNDIFLTKLDKYGNVLWRQEFGEGFGSPVGGADEPKEIITTSDGGFLIVGCHDCQSNNPSAYVIKTNSAGELLWEKILDQPIGNEQRTACFNAVIEDSNGDYVFAGGTQARAATDNLPAIGRDIFVCKINEAGEFIAEPKVYGGLYTYDANAIQETPLQGGYILCGTNREIDYLWYDLWSTIHLLKVDDNCNQEWNKQLLSSKDALEIWVHNNGDYYIAGSHYQDVEDHNTGDVFVIRTDNLGNNLQELLMFGETARQEAIEDFKKTSDDGFIITGITKYNNPDSGEFDSHVFSVKMDEDGNTLPNTIKGKIYFDENSNCLDDDELGLDTWVVEAEGNGETYYSTTDTDGNYSINVDVGTYALSLSPPNGNWEATCIDSPLIVNSSTPSQKDTVNIAAIPTTNCSYIEVDISTPILKPCIESAYTINYCNRGTETAFNTTIDIEIGDNLMVNGGDVLAADPVGNGSFSFPIGDVLVGQCGSFEVKVTPLCDLSPIGRSHSSKATATATNLCTDPVWAGPLLDLKGRCSNDIDSITFVLTNVGLGNMSQKSDFIIIEDELLFRIDSTSLDSGDSIKVTVPNNGSTYYFETNQVDGYNGKKKPILALESCSFEPTISTGYVTQYPENDDDAYVSMDCQENIESLAHGLERGYPKGIGPDHLIKPNQDIEYHIFFDNLVSDTIQEVIIRDTLSPFLDITSVRPGASSHPYEYSIYGNGVIKFRFSDLNLVHQYTDSKRSRGFIKFRVKQLPDNPEGTYIVNKASVQLDYYMSDEVYNTFHIIEKEKRYVREDVTICSGDQYKGVTYTEDASLIETFYLYTFDSLLYTNIEVLYSPEVVIDTLLSEWEEYRGEVYTEDAVVTETFMIDNGCDSTFVTNIFVKSVEYGTEDVQLCSGATYEGVIYQNNTTIYDTLYYAYYDSIVTKNIEVFDLIETESYIILHSWETYNGVLYSEDTTLEELTTASNGCDSTAYTHISIIPVQYGSSNVDVCYGESYNGVVHESDIVLVDTLEYVDYDSIGTTYLKVLEQPIDSVNVNIHSWDSYNGINFTQDSVLVDVYPAANSCDSTVMTNVRVRPLNYGDYHVSYCKGHIYYGQMLEDDTIWYQDTTYHADYDSITRIFIDILHPSESNQSYGVHQTEPYNGVYYTENTTLVDTLIGENGCDSIVYTALTVIPLVSQTEEVIVCENEMFNGVYYSADTTLYDTLLSLTFDLITVTNINVLYTPTFIQNISLHSWEPYNGNGVLYEEDTVLEDTYSATNGCDSIVTTNITVIPVVYETMSEIICENEPYNGVYYSENTMIYDTIIGATQDLIEIINLEVLKTSNTAVDIRLHAWEEFNGEIFTKDTSFDETFQAANGCDSIHTTNISLIPLSYENYTVNLCEGEEHEGVVYEYDTILSDTLSFQQLDKIVTTTINVHEHYDDIEETVEVIEGEAYEGIVYTENTTIVKDLSTIYGCDSTVFVTLEIVPAPLLNNGVILSEVHVYPNPTKQDFILEYQLHQVLDVTIELFNPYGQIIKLIDHEKAQQPGAYNKYIDISHLQNGTYMIQVQTDKRSVTKRIVKIE